jgi:hypothetical protein
MDDERIAVGRLAPKEPSITIWAALQFSSLGNGKLPSLLQVYRNLTPEGLFPKVARVRGRGRAH